MIILVCIDKFYPFESKYTLYNVHLCKPLKKYTILLLDYLRLSSSRQGKENLHKLQFLPVGSDIVFLTSSITTLSEYFLLFPSLDVDST